jgi:hypothetical protein
MLVGEPCLSRNSNGAEQIGVAAHHFGIESP